ncbi:MAG: Eco57I restriction-modification methylase domain-containing protein, partial [Candidatus Aenigmarchaeota archaeon]|nr:Eco57I restriction-modification methylase domain-containing protein [Candidatus Aenigmarchaeota archaeon]MDW8148996.1 Eco57I restriction-modification methylase domain-containing protein [Candidatus Aenigmarchaeota archaeon]
VDREGLVLDTGFGRGAFLKKLIEKDYKNCWGVEIDPQLYELTKKEIDNKCNLILGDFLQYRFDIKFDLIIGNPPYIHYTNLPQNMKDIVKNITKTSESDIYYAFIIKAIEILKEGGELIYIVPYHFFYNTHGKIVRNTILLNGKIDTIIDLDETRIFSGENPETIIFKFVKGSFRLENLKIKVFKIRQKSISFKNIIQNFDLKNEEIFEHYLISHFTTSGVWSSHNFEFKDNNFMPLGSIAKVGVGPVSGFDKAFKIKNSNTLTNNELKFIKNFVKAKNCKRYIIDKYTQYILIDNKIDEEEVKVQYPNIYSELVRYKDEMLRRYLPSGKKWFHWQALRNYSFLLQVLNEDKIFVPILDRHKHNRFSLGGRGALPAGDVMFIYPYKKDDLFFLLGYLNTDFFRNYYLRFGGRRGGRIVFTQKLLENTKIPLFPQEIKQKISEITQEIIKKKEKNQNTLYLENEIEKIVEKY